MSHLDDLGGFGAYRSRVGWYSRPEWDTLVVPVAGRWWFYFLTAARGRNRAATSLRLGSDDTALCKSELSLDRRGAYAPDARVSVDA